ncbi:hypothetical protein MtrunA17_Chr6g0483531 [Medicago truncatula]|uniref:Transmembrane protein n=1 Tax=Medicago truncatula TaxID=3880 RepID=A0A396HHB7_MEDTR|nr:hypothetical protein MtrunA17_Chr6g0483531 [Medicago truncatula]
MVNEYEKPNNTLFLLVEMRPIKKLVTKLETKKYEIHHQFFRRISHFLLSKFSSLIYLFIFLKRLLYTSIL